MAIDPKVRPPEPAVIEYGGKVGTLRPIELNLQKYRNLNFLNFVDQVFFDLQVLKNQRFNFYNGLREKSRANELRAWLVRLAAAAAALTAIATVVRIVFAGDQSVPPLPPYDIWIFASALLAYGVMGALGLIESTSDTSSRYFRYLGITMAIRDLWTKLEFAFLKEGLKAGVGDTTAEAAARDRVIALAEAFCNDLGKLISGELGEWRAEFIASISELDAIAKEGSDSAKSRLERAVNDYRAATAKAEEAEKAAKVAAKAAEEASKPALLNVTIEGEFDDTVTVRVDNAEMITTTNKSFAIEHLIPGNAKVEATAKKGDTLVSCGKWVALHSGIQPLTLSLE